MPIAEFALERFFARWEFTARHILCASDVEPLSLSELLARADDDGRRRWESLSLGYTESLGLPALRDEIARQYEHVAADDVITFAGAEEGVYLAMHALLAAGDHAVVVVPAYQSLHEVARSIGASVTLVPLDSRDWSLDVDAVAAAMRPNTRVIVINFPHSPTGAQLSEDQFTRLASIAELHGACLFSDEVYRFLEHDAPRLPTGADSSDRAASLGVMSKAYGLAGLRIGWIATRNAVLRERLTTLKDYTTICSSAPSEVLSLIGLRAKDRIVGRALQIIQSNLELLDDFFIKNAEDFEWVRPRATSVCFPKLLNGSVETFAADLVNEEGVLIAPGSLFGHGGNHFRLGYGRRDMPRALERLDAFVSRRQTPFASRR